MGLEAQPVPQRRHRCRGAEVSEDVERFNPAVGLLIVQDGEEPLELRVRDRLCDGRGGDKAL